MSDAGPLARTVRALAVAAAVTPMAGGPAAAAGLADEQQVPLWPGRPEGTPAELAPTIVERSETLFRADRALMGIAEPSITAILPETPNGTR